MRFIDKNITVLVSDNDYSKFSATRNIPIESMQDEFNLKIFDMNKLDIADVFTSVENDARAGLKPIILPQFSYTKLANNYYHFNNISFVHTENAFNPIYKWKLSNGSEFIGTSIPDILITENQLPLSMKLSVVNSPIQTDTFQMAILDCAIPFSYTQKGSTITIDVRNHPAISPGCNVIWNFGDGTQANGTFVTHTYSVFPWTSLLKTREVTGEIYCNGQRSCTFSRCINLVFNCENQKVKSKTWEKNISPYKYRIIGTLWASENFMSSSVGTQTLTQRKFQIGNYSNFGPAQQITITGGQYSKIYNFCCQQADFIGYFNKPNNISFTLIIPLQYPRYIKNQIWSEHKFIDTPIISFDPQEKLYLD